MKEDFKTFVSSLTNSNKNILQKLTDIPQKAYHFVTKEVKNNFGVQFIKKFIKPSKSCSKDLKGAVISKISKTLVSFGLCLIMKQIGLGKK